MKKAIPVIIAIALILLIGGIFVGKQILDRYSYSTERADLKEYFGISGEGTTAIILQHEIIEEKALLQDGTYYFDFATVRKYFNDRFYADEKEGLLLYTTPTEVIRTQIGTSEYGASDAPAQEPYVISFYQGETLYVAADYVRKFTNFSYEAFTEPDRMQVYTQWGGLQTASVLKDTQVRYQGGIKSAILTDAAKDDKVIILEQMDNWSKVKTKDCFIGYVENKNLSESAKEEQIPVTDYEEPEYTSLTREHKINLVWHQVFSEEANNSFGELMAKTKTVNVVAPTWFTLSDNNGNFSSLASASYVQAAHSMGLEVWAVVDNINNREIDTFTILSSTSTREYLVKNLIEAVKAIGIDGINVDFEQINIDTGDHYIQFIRELSVACRQNNIVLSVDNYVPTGYTEHYNRKEQGIVADYVIIMGYDEHYAGSPEAGPVASFQFVKDGIEQTIEVVPENKVINAVPFYTRIWKEGAGGLDSEALSMEAARAFITQNGIETYWNETTCHNYGEAQIGDLFYQIWLEDEKALEAKLSLMAGYQLGGVAGWKLGLESANAWDLIAGYMNQ